MITKFKFLLLPVVLFSLVCMNAFADQSYKFIDLGLQESDRSEALLINDNGLVAGTFWLHGEKYFFLWDEKNGIRQINLPDTANIVALNNPGQIAGNYNNENGQRRGYVWDERCGYFDIGTLGGDFTHIYDMNDFGHVVGQSECSSISRVDEKKEQHAFVWCGCMLDLGALNGDLGMCGDASIATGINNKGQIVGISNYLIVHKGKFKRSQYRSFLWCNGHMEGIDLDIGPQYGASGPSINNCGMAIFNNNEMGWFVVDLSTREIIDMPLARNLGRGPKITDKNDLVFGSNPDIVFIKRDKTCDHSWNGSFYEYVNLATSFDSLEQWYPNSFRGKDYNNNRWIVGDSTNIHGESHAVILVPITE